MSSATSEEEWEDQLLEVDPPVFGKSRVLLTAHARQQMQIRGISIRQVLQVIRNPHEFQDADMGRVRARRIRAGGSSAIDVVYASRLRSGNRGDRNCQTLEEEMKSKSFSVHVQAHPRTGHPMAAYFHVRDGKASEVRELADGAIFANYDRKGELLGVELLSPCKKSVLRKLSSDAPAPIRDAVECLLTECAPVSLLNG
jgi:hypothetical protein